MKHVLPEVGYKPHVHHLIGAFEAGVPRGLLGAPATASHSAATLLRMRLQAGLAFRALGSIRPD